MSSLRLGREHDTGAPVDLPLDSFRTHYHLVGATGKGKTTAIQTMLQQLLTDPSAEDCVILFDRLGGLSRDLLLWMASDYCIDEVRRRLVYVEPSNEAHVLGFNPLLYETEGEGYYKVQRATEIILRAWESVNLEAMPRLARWTFNAFWAAAQLGLTISDCVHFLLPGGDHFGALLDVMPPRLQLEWKELVKTSPTEVSRILDSTRNRLKPYFDSSILRRMFGSTRSRLDVAGFMREGKIVLLNLAPRNRLSTQLADAIGALVLNEVFAVARSLPEWDRYPTYLLLDEFQNFVGPDIEAALAEVRQLELRLILSHQSLSQLKRGDHDLTNMIFQAQSRMIFGVQGEDADLLAHELASIEYDPMRVKEENWVRRQRLVGHEVRLLESWNEGGTAADQWSRDYGENWNTQTNYSDGLLRRQQGGGTSHGNSERRGEGGSSARSWGHGTREQLVPVHEDYLELANRVFSTFEEQRHVWASRVRRLKTGRCVLRQVDDDRLRDVAVDRWVSGYLDLDPRTLRREFPEALEAVERLREENFRSGLFATPEEIDRETQQRLESVLRGPSIQLPAEEKFG